MELAKTNPHVTINIDWWLRGRFDWETCLKRILNSQIRQIDALINKHGLKGKVNDLECLRPVWEGDEGVLVRQSKLIEAIAIADAIEKRVLEFIKGETI